MKIAAVIVTYNRLDKLKIALEAYEVQKKPVDDLIIVDNCSTDGTRDFLRDWENVEGVSNRHVIYMNENLGGSGGFHDGCEFALTLAPDWILVADDDAYPEKQMISIFCSYVANHDVDGISSICSTVINSDNSIACYHRRILEIKRHYQIVSRNSREEDYTKESFPISLFSYVGTFLRADSLRKVGLCKKDFFIYYDDSEHSIRMSKTGQIICVPSLKVFHDDAFTIEKKVTGKPVLWREYYGTRNKLYTLLRHYPMAGIYWLLLLIKGGALTTNGTPKEIKMKRAAVKDAIFSRLGKHPIYRP